MPVYFIQAHDGGPVKIGWAKDVDKRVAEIQSGQVKNQLTIREGIEKADDEKQDLNIGQLSL